MCGQNVHRNKTTYVDLEIIIRVNVTIYNWKSQKGRRRKELAASLVCLEQRGIRAVACSSCSIHVMVANLESENFSFIFFAQNLRFKLSLEKI